MKTPFHSQLRAEMESIGWNENSDFLRNQHLREKMNLWLREPANSQYKYTLFAPVVLAHARLAARAIQLKWKLSAKVEFSFQPTAEM